MSTKVEHRSMPQWSPADLQRARERAAEYADWFLYGAEALNVAEQCGAFRFVQKAPSDPPSYVRFTDHQLAAFVARIRAAGVKEQGNG